ncbi:pentatricopeptide repeat-containing protein At1g12300, mitochondrial-like [Pistacia vera]|uniref:pentatricopeptide repeat-containing protein At1g12300, mitochondrial-like n=1 Tax=Pistacia vera TaxID=55513 RepID=UPI001263A53D|nr:pentatricopeptide repeat-containing protein At1g12300, mitochondrial-like [Pistacia vera]
MVLKSLIRRFSSSPSSFTEPGKVTTTIPQRLELKVTQLEKFLQNDCKEGNVTLDEARYFFGYMIHMQPKPPISSFNRLFGALAKKKFYEDVILLYKRVGSMGLLPDLYTLNILINCFCNVGREYEAVEFLKKMVVFGVRPNVITYGPLINGLCRTGNTTIALDTRTDVDKPDLVTFITMINGLCKRGKMEEANDGFSPNVVTYNNDKWLCKEGKMEEANGYLESMIQRGYVRMVFWGSKIVLYLENYLFKIASLIDGFVNGMIEIALEIFHQLPQKGLLLDVVTYSIFIHGFCEEVKLQKVLPLSYKKLLLDSSSSGWT